MKKITIHRALTELKTIDERIERELSSFLPLGIHQADKDVLFPATSLTATIKSLSQAEHKIAVQASYDTVVALIRNKTEIKRAVVASNAVTEITVGKEKMTVADAITQKSYIGLKKRFLESMDRSSRSMLAYLNRQNEAVDKGKEALLNQALGGKTAHSEKDVENIAGPYLKMNTWHLSDPLEIDKKIKALAEEISTFETDIDAVLSESNAVTFIEVDI